MDDVLARTTQELRTKDKMRSIAALLQQMILWKWAFRSEIKYNSKFSSLEENPY